MGRKEHWDRIYMTTDPTALSWHQYTPSLGLDLIEQGGLGPATEVIDVGGGDAKLVDCLRRGVRGTSRFSMSQLPPSLGLRPVWERTRVRLLGSRPMSRRPHCPRADSISGTTGPSSTF